MKRTDKNKTMAAKGKAPRKTESDIAEQGRKLSKSRGDQRLRQKEEDKDAAIKKGRENGAKALKERDGDLKYGSGLHTAKKGKEDKYDVEGRSRRAAPRAAEGRRFSDDHYQGAEKEMHRGGSRRAPKPAAFLSKRPAIHRSGMR